MKAENRHYDLVHKKKEHPAAKCSNAKCIICHANKVFKVKNRQIKRQDAKDKD